MTALLCGVAILGETAVGLAWTLIAVNVAAAAVVVLSLWIGELPEDRKPFGPFTEVAGVLGFLAGCGKTPCAAADGMVHG